MNDSNNKRSNKSERPFKLKRKTITLEEKLEVIKRYENKERTCDIVRVTGLNEATLRCIRSNAEKIKKSYANSTPLGAKRSNRIRPKMMQVMEKQLVDWINAEVVKNSNVSLLDIKSKALSIFDDLKKDFPNEAKLDFTASSGWFHRFKVRQQLENIKFSGDCSTVVSLNTELFPQSDISENAASANLCFQNDIGENSASASLCFEENSSFTPKSCLQTDIQKDLETYDHAQSVNELEKANETYLNTLMRGILLKNLGQIEEALGNLQMLDNKVKNSSVIIKKVIHLLRPYYNLLQQELKNDILISEDSNISIESHSSAYENNDFDIKKELFDSKDTNELILPI